MLPLQLPAKSKSKSFQKEENTTQSLNLSLQFIHKLPRISGERPNDQKRKEKQVLETDTSELLGYRL